LKNLIVIIFLLLSSINLFADAAIEIQEGSVKNWIKYYEHERGMDIPELDSDKEGANNIDANDNELN
jgi:hypothetical protein